MKTYEIAPGSILQRMYLKNRIEKNLLRGKKFLEVGAGTGYQSRILLEAGMTGKGLDLNIESCKTNQELNASFISQGLYEVEHKNFFDENPNEKYDLILSCMVIEHLPDEDVFKYFEQCKKYLKAGGIIITLVPSCMKYWGIEDEVAGHFKRYQFSDFDKIGQQCQLKIHHMAGLTYPISNILFGLSNKLVNKAESHKKNLSMEERTVNSSSRKVLFKTDYPWYFKLALNSITLSPFYFLQNLNRKNPDAMVIYCELKP